MNIKKLNKSLVIVFLVFTFFYVLISEFIASQTFGDILSEVVNGSIPEEYSDTINFSSIEVEKFPPRLVFHDFSIDFKNEEMGLGLQSAVNRLEVGFNLFSNFEGKINLGNISLIDGYVKIKSKESKVEKDFSFEGFEKDFDTFLKKNMKGFDLGEIVISRGEIKDIYFEINKDTSFYVNDTALEVYRKKYLFDLDIEKVDFKLKSHQSLESFRLKAYISEKELVLEEFLAQKEVGLMRVDGLVESPFEKINRNFNLNVSGDFLLDELLTFEELDKFELQGNMRFNGTIVGESKIRKANFAIDLNQFSSKFVAFEKGAANLVYDNEKISIKNAFIKDGDGRAKVNDEFSIYDFKNDVLLSYPIKINLENFSLSKGLHVIPKVSEALDGQASGEVALQITRRKVLVSNRHKIKVKDLSIRSKNNEILKIKEIALAKSTFDFNIRKKELEIAADLEVGNKKLTAAGFLSEKEYAIETSDFFLDANSFYHIAGLDIKGYGKAKVKVEGLFPDIRIIVDTNLNKTMIEEFTLGRAESKIIIDLKKDLIVFEGLQGNLNSGTYRGKGYINVKNKKVNFKGNFDNLSLNDFRLLHKPITKNLNKEIWPLISGSMSGTYNITGGLDLDSLIVKGKYFTDNFGFLGERFSFVSANFEYRNKTLKVPRISINVGRGKVQGTAYYGQRNDLFKFNFSSSNVLTRDFTYFFLHSAGFVSSVDLTLVGEISPKSTQVNGKIDFFDSTISGVEVDDSHLKVDLYNGVFQLDGEYLNKAVVVESMIDLNKRNGNNSEFNATIDFDNWAYILNLFSSYEISSSYLKGSLKAKIKSDFNIRDINRLNLDFSIDEFLFSHPQVDYKSVGENAIKIVNGDILKWNLDIKGSPGEKFTSKGHGSIYKDYWGGITANLLLDKVNRVLNSLFNLKGALNIEGQISRRNDRGMPNIDVVMVGNDVSISKTGVPISLNDTDFNINYKNGDIFINKFKAGLGNGVLKLSGKMEWRNILPEIAISYEIDDGIIQLNDKSYIILDGQGNLLGKKRPYSLLGDLRINGGEILDELNNFNKGSGTTSGSEIRFLPRKVDYKNVEWLTLNLNTHIDKEIYIRNSLADLKMLGKVNFTGTQDSPIILGKIFSNSDINNKVIIRNNELLVDKFTLTFNGDRNYLNPIVDFAASVQISDYKVFAKMYGPVRSLAVEFSSDPYLNRQSILSLLAFGYAEDVTDRLSEQDRENLSSIGVGSFIFNQLKINEVLQDNLGVSLNLGTEFEQDDTSLLEGRSQTGGQVGNVRSTTKVQLNKKLNNDLNLSLSSSLSGNVGQQQKMNLNYNLKENVSVEGVYELRTDVEGEEERNDTSVGADLKFRWTFK